MSDFTVEYGLLAEYGASMATRAAAATELIRGARMDSPASAMPGAWACAAAQLLQGRYEAASRRVSEHLVGHPRKLMETADAYRGTEDSATELVRTSFGA